MNAPVLTLSPIMIREAPCLRHLDGDMSASHGPSLRAITHDTPTSAQRPPAVAAVDRTQPIAEIGAHSQAAEGDGSEITKGSSPHRPDPPEHLLDEETAALIARPQPPGEQLEQDYQHTERDRSRGSLSGPADRALDAPLDRPRAKR